MVEIQGTEGRNQGTEQASEGCCKYREGRTGTRALSKPVGNGSPVTVWPFRECGQECRGKRDEQKCFQIMSIFCVSSQCTDCFYVSE